MVDTVNPISQLKIAKRIADPIHGLIRLTDLEAKVLEHDLFQRLRRIKQLGIAEYVYPGANHTRFSHSIGVLNNVTLMYNAAYNNWKRNPEICGEINSEWIFSLELLQTTRLAALCHDLGHFPFSHNLENAFDWLEKAKIITRSFKHEELSSHLVKEILGSMLGDYTADVSRFIEGKYFQSKNSMFPNFLVSSAIDGDRMDYLRRDALYCGVDYGNFDRERLFDTIYPHRSNIGGKEYDILAIHIKGIEAVEQFLLARHRMHQTIYFNRTVVGFEAGLRRAFFSITSNNPPWDLPDLYFDEPEKFINFDENKLFYQLKRELHKRGSWLEGPINHRNSITKMGPYFYTEFKTKLNEKENKKHRILQDMKNRLEIPERDWLNDNHWMYAEQMKQTLIDPLDNLKERNNSLNSNQFKNTIFLIDNNAELIDPTSIHYGQTFLPYITNQTYHRFLFYCHKRDREKLKKELKPVVELFNKDQWRQISLDNYFI